MAASRDPFALHWSLYPRHYVAPKLTTPLVIDGNIDKDPWKQVPFSDYFDEIRGATDAPPGTRPDQDAQGTRMKMLWDDDYLYVAAMLQSNFTTQAHFTKRNSPIFQKDSDFEVFIDAPANCHDYKELEVNAINTVWNLLLDKPYDDGGSEHSGRIAQPGDKQYYEVQHQTTATKVIHGKLNDDKEGATWTVECALAFSDLLANTTTSTNTKPPKVGHKWRINFSRVEHEGDTNWTWQAQRIWDPVAKQVKGKVAMHLPDAWGYVEFGKQQLVEDGTSQQTPPPMGDLRFDQLTDEQRDASWPARLAAMNIYYAQRRYAELHQGQYAATVADLKELTDERILKPFQSNKNDKTGHGGITITLGHKLYVATVTAPDNSLKATVNHERLLTVNYHLQETATD
ncbi:Inherit from NOG: Domain of unknown function (DUF1083) [Seminavis robusta]|uniref:Carbohydrate-binding domain-containing protein n=1 Tax=Seminavis robusta TaxID=568900 RepID=A0A9N8DA96_9STRA|nr:Inherit from NOG: Domain of unknown function (DUF1083) [Seminavis robusta]|eukprot:Sro14_g010530.1 Inherit from NOG: Domain of unknown function (DUF1083) (400) ;mRNA; f:75309-76508